MRFVCGPFAVGAGIGVWHLLDATPHVCDVTLFALIL